MNPKALRDLLISPGIEDLAELPPTPTHHVETPEERAVRQRNERLAALEVLRSIPEEEVSMEDQLAKAFQDIAEAVAERDALEVIHRNALAAVTEARDNVDKLERVAKYLDKRTPADLNREYLDRQRDMRFEAQQRLSDKKAALIATGLLDESDVSVLSASRSPVDQAIAKKNQEKRQKGYR
jgi:hypothetical protein